MKNFDLSFQSILSKNHHMNLTFISDTHRKHNELSLPGGDILIHCGDFTDIGEFSDVKEFALFISKTNYKHKIVIAGNHDFAFENGYQNEAKKFLNDNGIIYLNDSGVTISGINFWGSPVQPEFFDWAFNRKRGADIKKHWDLIPDNTDILITHGPPFGILDVSSHGTHIGCYDLLDAVKRVKPKIHAFGHNHFGHGKILFNDTIFINASNLDEKYQNKFPPIVIEL